ncbi:AfsR/SARP family transcriptional regulator [Streptomyces sp. ISL-11]|uniref:AfsR/SARP family transcriptional regulator n=1 Tax=Streptomyces sp. ISL-11 TaxID=2819174 RepID=UPI0027E4E3DC|nr:AfsR/SARP family transcriptional regulator [Streptomyces sp. ISL-11]
MDLSRFEELHEKGRRALERGDFASAAHSQRQALALWRGPLLSDTPHGPLLEATAVRLGEARIAALEQRVRADLHLGRHRELIAELRSVTAEHPLREEFHGHLMLALFRAGRQAEALEVFSRLRRILVEDLAIEPGRPLQHLHQRILAGDATLSTAGATPARAYAARSDVARPCRGSRLPRRATRTLCTGP